MKQDLSQQAINLALLGNWKEALATNLKILKEYPNDVDSLNRMARAYFELGKIKNAKSTLNKVLKIDPYNSIALKCQNKWKSINKIDKDLSKQMPPEMFLEEPGKTKIIHLIHPCDGPIMAKLNCGDLVYENIKKHRITILSESGNYIGKLPDDISIKLKQLIKLGYRYVFAVRSINKNDIKIFIRETDRPEKFLNKPSFSPDMIDYIPYTAAEIVHEKVNVQTFEDESEKEQE